MRLTRVHVAQALTTGALISLPAMAAAHLARVLRLQVDANIAVFDGAGNEFAAVIESIRKETVLVRVGQTLNVARESPLPITLLQGVARGEKMDLVLQKATELGVTTIVPVMMARTNVRLDAEGLAKRHAHWRGVIISACEQCGRSTMPDLKVAQPLQQALATTAGLKLLLAPREGSPGLATLLGDTQIARQTGVALLVGPEGGFDDNEVALAREAGYLACRLGPRILRTETAGLAALAALQTLAGDLG